MIIFMNGVQCFVYRMMLTFAHYMQFSIRLHIACSLLIVSFIMKRSFRLAQPTRVLAIVKPMHLDMILKSLNLPFYLHSALI